jgi:hypothetical protein
MNYNDEPMNVYRVKLNVGWDGDQAPRIIAEASADRALTVAAEDAEEAIRKAKRIARQRVPQIDDDTGEEIPGKYWRVTDVRICAVQLVSDLDG